MNTRRSLLVLVGVDLASKAVAYLALPLEREVSFGAAFQLVLVLNHSGLGTAAARLLQPKLFAQLPVAASAYLSLAIAVIVVRRFWPGPRPRLTCLLAFLIPLFLGRLLLPQGISSLPELASVTLLRAAVTILLLVSWYVSTSNPWRLAFLFLAAGAAGNLLSLLLPPFAVVDFLYSKFLRAIVGYQVFNLADLYYLIGLAVVPMFAVRWLLQQAKAARDVSRA